MAAMVFDERFGEIPKSLATLMKKNNVSPSDFYQLEYELGEGKFAAFAEAIRDRSKNGSYNAFG